MLNYISKGNKNNIAFVFLHGLPLDNTIWNIISDVLSENYYTIQIDLPGAGKSSLREHPANSLSQICIYIEQILNYENINKCILIGHSMGGYIALEFLESHSKKIKILGLSLVNSMATSDDIIKKEKREKSIQFVNQSHHHKNIFIKEMIINMINDEYLKKNAELINNLISSCQSLSTESLVNFYKVIKDRTDKNKLIADTNIPIQYIVGALDEAAPYATTIKEISKVKTSFVSLYKNTAHVSILENDKQLAYDLSEFCHFCIEHR